MESPGQEERLETGGLMQGAEGGQQQKQSAEKEAAWTAASHRRVAGLYFSWRLAVSSLSPYLSQWDFFTHHLPSSLLLLLQPSTLSTLSTD